MVFDKNELVMGKMQPIFLPKSVKLIFLYHNFVISRSCTPGTLPRNSYSSDAKISDFTESGYYYTVCKIS